MPRPQPSVSLCTWWILLCAYCSLAGWVLSLAHALNALGYTIAFVIGIVGAWFGCRLLRYHCLSISIRPLRRHLRRPLPLAFVILAGLAFLGGALYAPSNWDALSYRVPRVLHWLAADRWHWIHTMFERLNVRGCGYEWTMAPLLALTRGDRLLFLPSFISFCLLPGLFFTTLAGVGVKNRAAWAWMWVLPSGYCYIVQAGSIGNDLFGSFFALAAVAYALRARRSGRLDDLWISGLAMALSTEVKANNLLLMAVWAVAVYPSLALLRRRVVATVSIAALALVVSLVPTAVLNTIHVHDWTGTKADQMQNLPGQHVDRILGNSAVVLLVNLTPPVAPFAKTWNTHVANRLLPRRFDEVFGTSPASPVLQMDELATEESAGLGFGVCILLIVSVVAAARLTHQSTHWSGFQLAVFAATATALAAFLLASFATRSEARLLNAYYAFLVLPFLLPAGHERLVRKTWWRYLALTVMALAALPLVLSPARPLFPAQTVLNLVSRHRASAAIARAQKVYSVYQRRAVALEPLAALLPPEAKVVGAVVFDDLETSLWKPFGSRCIVHVCPGDSPDQVRARGVQFIWMNARQFGRFKGIDFADWLAEFNAEVVQQVPLTLRGSEDATEWRLVRLKPRPIAPASS